MRGKGLRELSSEEKGQADDSFPAFPQRGWESCLQKPLWNSSLALLAPPQHPHHDWPTQRILPSSGPPWMTVRGGLTHTVPQEKHLRSHLQRHVEAGYEVPPFLVERQKGRPRAQPTNSSCKDNQTLVSRGFGASGHNGHLLHKASHYFQQQRHSWCI